MSLLVVGASILEGYSILATRPRMVLGREADYICQVDVIGQDGVVAAEIIASLRLTLSMRPTKRP